MPSRTGPPNVSGRWSLLPPLTRDATMYAHALAQSLLDRYGILTKGAVAAERIPGGFAAVYPVLRAMEEAGRARRGYFVEGLGAAQFAVPGAVDRMRALARPLSSGDDPVASITRGRPGRTVRAAGLLVTGLLIMGRPVMTEGRREAMGRPATSARSGSTSGTRRAGPAVRAEPAKAAPGQTRPGRRGTGTDGGTGTGGTGTARDRDGRDRDGREPGTGLSAAGAGDRAGGRGPGQRVRCVPAVAARPGETAGGHRPGRRPAPWSCWLTASSSCMSSAAARPCCPGRASQRCWIRPPQRWPPRCAPGRSVG